MRRIEENIIRVQTNNKISYFEAKDWIEENMCADAFSCAVKEKMFPTIQESRQKKGKKLNRIDRGNSHHFFILLNLKPFISKNMWRKHTI